MKFIVALNKIYLGHMDSSSMDVLWNIPDYGWPQGISTKAKKTGTHWVPLYATCILAFLEWLWRVKGQGIPAIQAVSEKKKTIPSTIPMNKSGGRRYYACISEMSCLWSMKSKFLMKHILAHRTKSWDSDIRKKLGWSPHKLWTGQKVGR